MKWRGIIWLIVFAFVTGLLVSLFFCRERKKTVYIPKIQTNIIVLNKKIEEKKKENSVLNDSKTNLEKDIYKLIGQYEN